MSDTIERLTEVLKERRGANPDSSYVASLYAKGLDAILEKVGEEATETLLAAKNADVNSRDDHLVHEVADLWFHSMVALVHLNQDPAWVLEELAGRFGISGHIEKASRE